MGAMAALSSIYEVYPPERKATVPLGLRVNDMVVGNGLNGCDLVTLEPAAGLRDQFKVCIDKVRDLVEGAGGSLANVARATAYVTSVEDRPAVNGEWWHEVFPDAADRPAYKVLLADLPAGELVRLDALALLGATRRRIDLPNISAFDPTVVIGNLIISSRCHVNDQDNDGQLREGGLPAEARQTFKNLRALADLGGGPRATIVQINTYRRDRDGSEQIRSAFDDVFADVMIKPTLHNLVNFVSPRMQIAADMVAVVGTDDAKPRDL